MDKFMRWFGLFLLTIITVIGVDGVHVTKNRVHFTRQPNGDVAVSLGSSHKLWCIAEDAEGAKLSVRWLHNGTEIKTSNTSSRVGVLILRDFHWSDQGLYQCSVTIAQGTVLSSQTNLSVQQPPIITQQPSGSHVRIGGVVRFHCGAMGNPAPMYNWTHDNLPLTADTGIQHSRLRILSSGTLQLVNVQRSDEGTYLCVASNPAGNITSRPAILSTSIPSPKSVSLKVLAVPGNISVKLGEDALFECMFDGPETLKVVWKRLDGGRIAKDRAHVIGTNLRIRRVERWDAGLYACVATEKAGKKPVQLKTSLSVIYSPKIVEYPVDRRTKRGNSARFVCITDANPLPQITWYRDGLPVQSHPRFKFYPQVDHPVSMTTNRRNPTQIYYNRALLISSVQESDQGVYQCVVSNSIGMVSAASILEYIPTNVSETPENLIGFVEQKKKRIQLEWDKPKEADVAVYLIHFYPVGEKENVVAFTCHTGHCVMRCCGDEQTIRPFTNYTFIVNAVVNGDQSPNSNAIVVQSFDGVATRAAPLTVTGLPGSRVRLDWEPLEDPKDLPGVLQEYKLEYNQEEKLEPKRITFPFPIHEHTLSGLVPNSSYSFRVIPKTRAGYPKRNELGVESRFPWVKHWVPSLKTGEEPALLAPNIEVTAWSNVSIHVLWTIIDQNPISGFIVRYQPQDGSGKREEIKVDPNTHNVVIDHLAYNMLYKVSVAAVSPSGRIGLESSKMVETSVVVTAKPITFDPVCIVEPPEQLYCKSVGPGHLIVFWNKPSMSSYNIVRYQVRITGPLPDDPDKALNSSYVDEVSVDGESLSFTNLIPDSIYLFAAKSFDDKSCDGPYSSPEKECSVPGYGLIPDKPLNVNVKSLNKTTVLVSWKPPSNKRSAQITHYLVYFTDSPGNTERWKKIVVNGSETALLLDISGSDITFVKVSAETLAGEGPHSDVVVSGMSANVDSGNDNQREIKILVSYKEGIIIGVCIALICIVICAIILIRKLRKEHSTTSNGTNSWWPFGRRTNETPIKANGHVHHNGHLVTSNDHVEMQTLLPPFLENYHCDAKGGDDGAKPSGCSRVGGNFTSFPVEHIWSENDTVETAEMDPLVLNVGRQTEALVEVSSDLSHSPLTANSLHSWSHEERISHPATSSLPNLTDSGIGFDDPSMAFNSRHPKLLNGNGSSVHRTCWCRANMPLNGLSALNGYHRGINRWAHTST